MKKSRTSKTSNVIVWALGLIGIGTLSTAYLDPGSGSFLIQIVIAALLGAGLLIRTFWGQISAIFGRKPKETDGLDDPDNAE